MNSYLALDFRIVLAVVFASAGVMKLRDVSDARALLDGIGFRQFSGAVLKVLPLVELSLAVWLFTAWQQVLALAICGGFLILFSVVMLIALRHGYVGTCSCFGRHSSRIDVTSVAFNGFLLVLTTTAIALELSNHQQSPMSIASIRFGDVLAIVFIGGWLLAVNFLMQETESLHETLRSYSRE